MKAQPVTATASLILKNGTVCDICDRLTFQAHLENARRIGAKKLTFGRIEYFIK